jgi:transposase
MYELLRAHVVEGRSFREMEDQFGYSRGQAWRLWRQATAPMIQQLFGKQTRAGSRTIDAQTLREMVIEWRKQNYSVYDIARFAREHRRAISPSAVGRILKEEGFARLPRRADDERPQWSRPGAAAYADAQALNLAPGERFSTRWGGVLLFLPFLADLKLDRLIRQAGYPGSKMVPAPSALLSLLALKLMGRERRAHVMDACEDAGVALLAGVNVLPKTTFLSDYSYRMGPTPHRKLMGAVDRALYQKGWMRAGSFNVDFHSIAYYGELGRLERNYVPRRSQAERSVLTFFAQEYQSRVVCYANANILKADRNEEILRFVDFWEETTGQAPEELVFDSQLTTYEVLAKLHRRKIKFLTLRRRSPKVVARLRALPKSAWREVELDVPQRKYRYPLIYEEQVQLKKYPGKLRQIAAMNLGREEPTLLLTDDFKRTPAALFTRYAQRTLIENGLSEAVHFFHVDALSSSIRLKVDLDCVLTVLASLCYHWLARQLKSFETAQAKTVWRKFVDRSATIEIGDREIVVRLQRHNHAPLLMEAGFARKAVRIPWLHNKLVRYEFR